MGSDNHGAVDTPEVTQAADQPRGAAGQPATDRGFTRGARRLWKAGLASLGVGITATLLTLSLSAPTAPISGATAAADPGSTEPEPVAVAALDGAGSAESEPAATPPASDEAPADGLASTLAWSMAADDPASSVSTLDPDLRPSLSDRTGLRPAPEPTATPKPERQIEKYTVAEGDTVSGIADRFEVSVDTIVKVNGLDDPENLTPGQELVILPISGLLHTVEDGDTVLDLATRYGVIPEDIVAVNKLADPNALQLDQQLIIPEAPLGIRAEGPAEPQPLAKPMAPIDYTIVEGDTLTSIAGRHGISTDSILAANPDLADPEQLTIGQTLVLPPVSGLLHTVVEGDTVNGLAAYYSASAAELIRVNALQEPYVVTVGQVLVVPGGTRPAPVVSAPAPAPAQPAPAPAPASPPKPAPQPAAPAPAPAPASSGKSGNAASIALEQVGSRYVWGGTGPGGFDCSGLTFYAFRQAGRPIPRDLWGQLNSGPRIARGDLQSGDLVFFQNTYKPGLSHVGIYVGGGRFVHAGSEHTGVIVTNLGDPYWNARYLGASRP